MFVSDYILNEVGYGETGEALGRVHFDAGLLRPYFDGGHVCVTMKTGKIVTNAETGEFEEEVENVRVNDLRDTGLDNSIWNATTLRKDEWVHLDAKVTMAARQRLRAWTDAYSVVGTSYDGFSVMTHEYEAQSDPGEAVKDMDVLADGRTDAPLYKLRSAPLPIIHSDFYFSERRIAVSRNKGIPVSMVMGEAAARRVGEMVERTLIGTETGITYGTHASGSNAHDGTSTEYGYTTFPARNTKTDLNTPTGTNPEAVMTDVLEMVETLQSDGFFGPYMLYHSTGYSRYLNDDYFRTGSTSAVRSLRSRILEIDGIADIRRLDYLTSGYQLILVQMTTDVIEAINGMEVQTIMWESQGGMRKNFRVMCIHTPLLKSDYNGNSGLVHGTTS